MAVEKPNAEYLRMADRWKRCRDAASGQDAVHDAGALYLPALKDQPLPEYQAYVKRTPFFNATYRTISGLVGMLFRKPPMVEVPAAIDESLDDVTMGGIPLHVLAQQISYECLDVGRAGLLVDYPEPAKQPVTVAQAQSQGLRPMIQLYKAETIINWRSARVNNAMMLTLVVLKESAIILKDEFTESSEDRWRVLDLSEGRYRVRVFMREKDKDILLSTTYPMMNSRPLKYIPFVFIGVDDLKPEIDEPPLIDLVNLNLSHYRTTADLEHGAHFTGLPTPVVSGYTTETSGEKLYIGSSSAWVFPSPDAKAFYLEFTGQGLGALESILNRKEQQMAILGARMLEPQRRAIESADAASIHRKGEESTLSAVAQTISMGITQALKWFSEWAGAGDKVEFDINRDFYPAPMDAGALTALVSAWQSGAFSRQVLFDNLQKGEVIDIHTTIEEEEARIGDEAPRLLATQTQEPPAE